MNTEHIHNLNAASVLGAKSQAEREYILSVATERYMRGKMSMEELEKIEDTYLNIELAKAMSFITQSSQSA